MRLAEEKAEKSEPQRQRELQKLKEITKNNYWSPDMLRDQISYEMAKHKLVALYMENGVQKPDTLDTAPIKGVASRAPDAEELPATGLRPWVIG